MLVEAMSGFRGLSSTVILSVGARGGLDVVLDVARSFKGQLLATDQHATALTAKKDTNPPVGPTG